MSFDDGVADFEGVGPPTLPPREGLLPAFAVRLADQRGISLRSSYPATDVYREPVAGDSAVAVKIALPLAVEFIGLHCGYMIFDFSRNGLFCGGELPGLYGAFGEDRAYAAAARQRNDLVNRRAQYMNAFMSTLSVGGQQASAGIGPQQPVHLGNYLSAFVRDNGEWHVQGPGAAPPLGGWPRIEVYLPGDAFRNSAHAFSEICKVLGEDAVELLSLLQDCISQYRNHQFSSALVVGWAVAEALLSRKWQAYIKKAGPPRGHTKINKDRRDRLLGRDFTVSVVTEILSLAGELDDQKRETLDLARKARNDFVHRRKPCPPEKAFLPALVSAQLIGQEAGFDFRVSSGYSYQT